MVFAKKRATGFNEALTPKLWDAIEQNDAEAVKNLLKQNANPNARKQDLYILHYAVAYGSFEIVKLLLEAPGIDKDMGIGETQNGPLEWLKQSYREYPQGATALSTAADCGRRIRTEYSWRENRNCYEELIKLLISHGVDLAKGDPILQACWGWDGSDEMIQLLVKAGSPVWPDSLKAAATRRKDPAMVKLFIAAGADVHAIVYQQFYPEDFANRTPKPVTMFSVLMYEYERAYGDKKVLLEIIEQFLCHDVDTEVESYKRQYLRNGFERNLHTKTSFMSYFSEYPELASACNNAYSKRKLCIQAALDALEIPGALIGLVDDYAVPLTVPIGDAHTVSAIQ